VIKNAAGEIVELRGTTIRRRAAAMRPTAARSRRRCTGSRPRHAVDAEVRLYDRLFTSEDPEGAAAKTGADFTSLVNQQSLEVLKGSKLEPVARRGGVRLSLSIRAAGIFLRRSRFARRRAGIQSDGVVERQLDEVEYLI
jgi:glutaminyl-tRNA synthetase